MSRFGQVEMSQSRPPELLVLKCGDGRNSGDDHDEHARGRSSQAGACCLVRMLPVELDARRLGFAGAISIG